jgi:hypothetical protein
MEKSRMVNDVLFSGSLPDDAIKTEYDNWAKTGNYIKVTASRAGTAHPSGAHEFIPRF